MSFSFFSVLNIKNTILNSDMLSYLEEAMNLIIKSSLFFLLILTASCSSNNTSKKETVEISQIKITKEFSAIAGTIISIDSIRTSTDKNSPCSKTPCWAKVKVDNVIGIGQGGPSVSIGDTLYTRFAFTLAETTEELIPNLDKRMPGLNITDSFEANIKSMASNNSDKLYEIYFYTKK